MDVFAVYFQVAENGTVKFPKYLVVIPGTKMTLVPRLALPKMVRTTLLCDCGQNMVFFMLHTSTMSPTRTKQSMSM